MQNISFLPNNQYFSSGNQKPDLSHLSFFSVWYLEIFLDLDMHEIFYNQQSTTYIKKNTLEQSKLNTLTTIGRWLDFLSYNQTNAPIAKCKSEAYPQHVNGLDRSTSLSTGNYHQYLQTVKYMVVKLIENRFIFPFF
jgi:hypothetical protein